MKSKILYGIAAACLLILTINLPRVFAAQEGSKIHWKGSIKADQDLSDARVAEMAKIGLEEALRKALAKVPGKAIKAELESEGGYLIYSVEVVTADGRLEEVILDPADGKVLAMENETSESRSVDKD